MNHDVSDPRYAPNGLEWWKLTTEIGTRRRFGGEKRLAAWLQFEKNVGDTFTMRDLRAALGEDGAPDTAEHLNRRLRELRKDDWQITSYKRDRHLPQGTYRLDAKGTRVWLGERNTRGGASEAVRAMVIRRDGGRCRICGVGSSEQYPNEPNSAAVMTVGHITPQERGGTNDPDNLRTECSRCNETVRDLVANPETYDEVVTAVRNLKANELRSLLTWMQNGQRARSKLDEAFDRARLLSPTDRERMITALENMIG